MRLLQIPGVNLDSASEALIPAAGKYDTEVLKLLVNFQGLDPNKKLKYYSISALVEAIDYLNVEVVEILLAVVGIDVNIYSGRPLRLAKFKETQGLPSMQKQASKIVSLLVAAGAN